MALLEGLGRDIPLILHGLSEAEGATCVAFLRAEKGHTLAGASQTGAGAKVTRRPSRAD